MSDEEIFLAKRFAELADKSYKCNQYFFTDFLSLEDAALLRQTMEKERFYDYSMSGGASGCMREMARFGNEESIGYEMAYPILIVKVQPLIQKFADELTHRDFLGALMNLGIKREKIGDIIIRNNEGYVFVVDKIADFIVENLSKIKHTNVKCSVMEASDIEVSYKMKTSEVLVPSLRIDAIIAKKCNLSRSKVLELMREKKVFLSGRVMENGSYNVKEGDVITVRGYGKMIFVKISGETKKGKIYVTIEEFV